MLDSSQISPVPSHGYQTHSATRPAPLFIDAKSGKEIQPEPLLQPHAVYHEQNRKETENNGYPEPDLLQQQREVRQNTQQLSIVS